MTRVNLEIEINGKLHKVEIDPSTLLLDLLRDELELTGAREGVKPGIAAVVPS